MAVTMLDIAKRLDLSAATVSRVLSGKGAGFISSITRDRVMHAAKEMGYRPNRVAQGLVSGKTRVIALWVRNPDAPYYAGILRSVQELATDHGYEMILSGYRDEGEEVLPDSIAEHDLRSWPVDGVIAADCPLRVQRYRDANPNTPVVAISTDEGLEVDSVTFDQVAGIQEAMQHLFEIGCRKPVHMSALFAVPQVARERKRVFEEACAKAGIAGKIVTAKDESRAAAREQVKKLWHEGGGDALFCINDDVAIGAYRGLRDLGVKVGEEVALVGVDNIPDAAYIDPDLTSVRQPVEEMCRRAWDLLNRRWEEPTADIVHESLKPTLVTRDSTKRFKRK